MKATTVSALVVLAALNFSRAAAQTSLYIPGFDPQPITADIEGVDAQGRTTWRIGPGVTSGTFDQDAGIEGSVTLIADATEAQIIWANAAASMTLSESCAIANGIALCSGFAAAAGTGESFVATETASPFEVQGNTDAVPTGSATTESVSEPGTATSGAATETGASSSTPTAGSGLSSGPSATSASTSANPTGTTQGNGVGKVKSSSLVSFGVVGLVSVLCL
ncbi:hypothetical protein BD414DRAFT_485265 [Trametes punicea]|nr:hypothetical protein BD414DRAFT_485265 [Trametes punicea]